MSTLLANYITVMHRSSDAAGQGGTLKLNANAARVGFRFTVPYGCTPEALHFYYSTTGAPGSAQFRLVPGDPLDPSQPDLSANTKIRWIPAPSASPAWLRLGLASGGTSFQTPLAAGTIMHVVFERRSGTFDANNYISFFTLRSRFPLPFVAPELDGVTYRDDWSAAMASVDPSAAATPYCVQRGANASYHPLYVIECADAPPFGLAYDSHHELVISGTKQYSQRMFLPATLSANFVAFFLRGSGTTLDLGVPAGDLELTILRDRVDGGVGFHSADHHVLFHGPVALMSPQDRLFKSTSGGMGRSHWFGVFLGQTLLFDGGPNRLYTFKLSAPLCSGVGADGYVFSYETSALDPASLSGDPPGYLGASAWPGSPYDILGGPTADTGFLLRLVDPTLPIAIGDEVLGDSVGNPDVFPLVARHGDTLRLTYIVRNIGADSGPGGIWSRVRDGDTGASLSNLLHTIVSNNEDSTAPAHAITMPNADLALRFECGHFENASEVVDSFWLSEVRLVP
jgi:hypothetical protein